MPLVDDLREPLDEREMSRRRLLLGIGGGALAAAAAGTAVTGVRYLQPNVLFEAATRFAVGRPDEIAEGQVVALPERKVFVVRGPEGCYAMSAVCTHLGCMVQARKGEGGAPGFFCPCHGSAFDLQGRVTGGPAPRPLDRLDLAVQGGKLIVDVRKKVPHGTVLKV